MAESLMDKERYRWSYMTENQLTTRLKRITNPEKLRCFIRMSVTHENRLLNHLAIERLKQIDTYYNPVEPIPDSPCVRESKQIVPRWTGTKIIERKKPKKKAEDNIRTILI